jgi:hypothetical protein
MIATFNVEEAVTVTGAWHPLARGSEKSAAPSRCGCNSSQPGSWKRSDCRSSIHSRYVSVFWDARRASAIEGPASSWKQARDARQCQRRPLVGTAVTTRASSGPARFRHAAELDHRAGHEDASFGVDAKQEPRWPGDRIALLECRTHRCATLRDHPAAEIRAGRAGRRIFEERAVCRDEEANGPFGREMTRP